MSDETTILFLALSPELLQYVSYNVILAVCESTSLLGIGKENATNFWSEV